MTPDNFYILFGVAWVAGAAYGLSAVLLLARVKKLQAAGKVTEAPDPMRNPLDLVGYLVWLMTGRYAELGDASVTRLAWIARVMFVIALPSMLAVFAIVFTQPELLN